MKNEELEALIDSLLDADLSEADFLRLEAEMLLRPEARQLYYDKLRLDTLLCIEAEQAGTHGELTHARRPPNCHAIGLGAAAAIGLLASAISGWFVGTRSDGETRTEDGAMGRLPLVSLTLALTVPGIPSLADIPSTWDLSSIYENDARWEESLRGLPPLVEAVDDAIEGGSGSVIDL